MVEVGRLGRGCELGGAGREIGVEVGEHAIERPVEHVADLESYLAACHRLVRSGGATFIATINRNPFARLVAIFGAEYVLRWLPRGTHRYHLLRKPDEIQTLLTHDGMRLKTMAGVIVNPLTRTMRLSRSTLVNYMLCATKV